MSKKVYVLRFCQADGTSTNDFRWPKKGHVECPDWDPNPYPGHGLHGFLNGCSKHGSLWVSWPESNSAWLVVEVNLEDIVALQEERIELAEEAVDLEVGTVKFPRGEVLYFGTKEGALAELELRNPAVKQMPVFGSSRSSPYAITGAFGDATGKYVAVSDFAGKARVTEGVAMCSGEATAEAGVAYAPQGGTAIAYNDLAYAEHGDAHYKGVRRGFAVSRGKATTCAGYALGSTVTALGGSSVGYVMSGGKGQGDHGSVLCFEWYPEEGDHYTELMVKVAYVGKDIEPSVFYRCTNTGELVKATEESIAGKKTEVIIDGFSFEVNQSYFDTTSK